ncbi:peptidase [Alteromonas sp. KS69]|jgi:hydrogenase maturation protease|uniref:HyaD/HybD family hydrogenase maturation endopeptidase n=1 Tax=unclassified Alteromonas TaxID=2614992 RepID=UPI0009039F7B|nr:MULTISPECIES: HyaD/HybD family hydrogenase maturation endopeptidase [unclassified Alteromonas]APE05206.1 peptidase [Alteromonas sp. RW2A1]RUP77338.1 peptidase [Alteromonas sp. KS69]|tara:strand:+ start:6653 stop:7207 length:555 start_codon:yes stop_codon:yes gene_type:complete
MQSAKTCTPAVRVANKVKQYTIIGVGNILQRDDGVGIHAIQALQPMFEDYSNVSCIDAGTLSYELLEWVSNSDHTIVIDAAYMRCPAGTVKVFKDDEIAQQFEQATAHSVHQITLRDTLLTSQTLFSKPTEVTLIGVEPETIEWGTSLSPKVSVALSSIMDIACACLSTDNFHANTPAIEKESR